MRDEKEKRNDDPDPAENSDALTVEELGAGIDLSRMFDLARQKEKERGQVIPLGRPWQGKDET